MTRYVCLCCGRAFEDDGRPAPLFATDFEVGRTQTPDGFDRPKPRNITHGTHLDDFPGQGMLKRGWRWYGSQAKRRRDGRTTWK